MKKLTQLLFLSLFLFLLIGCSNNGSEESQIDSANEDSFLESSEETNEGSSNEEESTDSGQAADDEFELPSTEENDQQTGNPLSGYSNEEIEYARVWLLLGPNQEIDELNVRSIPAGTAINPNDETSAVYPEEIVQLAGSRLVDGSVAYSGNGDGTIDVYNVPLRWESNIPDDLNDNYMQEYTRSIIEDTETVYIDPGSEEEIIELIDIMTIH